MRRYFKGRRRENRWFHLRTTDGTLVQVAGPPKPMRSYAKT